MSIKFSDSLRPTIYPGSNPLLPTAASENHSPAVSVEPSCIDTSEKKSGLFPFVIVRISGGAASSGKARKHPLHLVENFPVPQKVQKEDSPVQDATTPEEAERIEGLMQNTSFNFILPSFPEGCKLTVETFLRSNLPELFKSVLRGKAYAKCTSPSPSLGEFCIRCSPLSDSKEYEVYSRYVVTLGGSKKIYKQHVLSGPQKGAIFAYGKVIQTESEYLASRMKEMGHELKMGASLPSSPYIVPIEMVMKRKDPSKLKAIRMPWCNSGDLGGYCFKPTSEHPYKERLQIAVDIARGLQVIHECGRCHLDIKPGNILLHRNRERLGARISDFGRMLQRGQFYHIPATTREYMAFEQIFVDQPSAPAMDMWGFGLILLELVHGSGANPFLQKGGVPFDENSFNNPRGYEVIRQHWVRMRASIMERLDKSSTVDQLIENLLSCEPEYRPTAAGVVKTLEDVIALVDATTT